MSDQLYETQDTSKILMSANAYMTMRENLEQNIGSHKAKGFLFRYGRDFGEEAARNYLEKRERKGKIGKMHVRLGHVTDVTFNGKIVRHDDGTIECINTTGQWIESFEAAIQLKHHGLSTEPVCHTLCGFASGALSYEFGVSLIVIETKCFAKGDDCCEYEIRLEEDWLPEKQELVNLYQSDNILSELEMTYDALLQHKQLLERLSVFQTQLTQSVTERYSMAELIDEAQKLLDMPILIEDIHGQLLKQSGLSTEQRILLETPATLIYEKDVQNIAYYESAGYAKLSSPVTINKKHYATCSFIYMDGRVMEESDAMFLEKVASVVALCILYEEAQFEEQQRMRSSIIERLIHKQNIASIESSFKFLPFQFSGPYTTSVIRITPSKKAVGDLLDYHDQLMQLSRMFDTWRVPTILADIGEEIVLLTSHTVDARQFKNVCTKVLKKMNQQNANYTYALGMSRLFTHFTSFEQSLKEAHIAQRFENQQLFTDYEELGMLGDLVTNMSIEQIHDLAQKMLKGLYDYNNPRKKELLYTLYIYLLNNQRLKETMEYLNLSIGGIQYRIKQIEEQLEDTLKNASLAAYALLLIQALLLLGEVKFT